jgi:hypothetical protein
MRSQRVAVAALAILAASMIACGYQPLTIPATPPPPPPPFVVAQGTGALEAGFLAQVTPFRTPLPGRLDATVDWTFATNDVDAIIVSGECSLEQFDAGRCPVLAVAAGTTAKPERLTVPAAAPGTYTLFIGNEGPEDESLSFQVVLTPSAATAAAAAPLDAAGAAKLLALRGRRAIH